jgi:WD40 repeat protein
VLWDISSGQLLRRFSGHTKGITAVNFSPDTRFLITASNDGTARLYQTFTGELIDILVDLDGSINVAEFSPNGDYVVTAGTNSTVKLWNL